MKLIKIYYGIITSAEAVGVEFDDAVSLRGFAVGLDSVINFDGLSHERAYKWLPYFHSDIASEIDERLLNVDSGDESKALMNLRGFSVDIANHPEPEILAASMGVYIENILTLDTEVPYSCRVEGSTYIGVAEEGFSVGRVSTGEHYSMLLFDGLLMLAIEDNSEGYTRKLIPCVTGVSINDRQDVKGLRFVLPIDSLQDVVSVRHQHYS